MATVETMDGIDVRAVEWVRNNRRAVTIAAGVLVLLLAGLWFWWSAAQRKENFAERALQSARASAEAGNLPLAASDLARLSNDYAGTRAAEEAALLLAQIRLLDNQPAIAASDLRVFVERGPREEFRAPAYGLLGAALEESGQFAEAASAYGRAAEASPYKQVQEQHLLDAARAFTASGDTAQAIRTYERILSEASDGPGTIESRIRLSELRKGAGSVRSQQ